MLRFKHFVQLLEAKIDDYKSQVTDISTEHDPHAEHKSPSDIIDHFHKHVPGGNVQNTRWLIDRYKKGEMKQEDAPDMHDTLKDFEKYKQHLPKKNIGQYKSISDLKTAIHPHKEKDEQVKAVNNKKVVEGSTVVHDSPKVTVYHVHTTAAAQELGKNPKGEKLGWCTSHPDPDQNRFNQYNEDSDKNFHILHMHHEKFPYRRIGGVGVDGQFQDENNKLIEGKDFHDLLHRNPELHKIPAVTNTKHYASERTTDPNLSKKDMDKFVNDKREHIRWSVAEHPNLHKEHIDKLVNDNNNFVRMAIAGRSDLPKEHIDKLVNDEDSGVRSTMAKRNDLSKKHVDKLINDNSDRVRTSLASRVTNKEHMDKLVDDKEDAVKSSLAHNPNLHKEHIDKLINNGNSHSKFILAHNPNLHKDHIDKLINDKYSDVRWRVAKHPNLTKEHIDKLVNDTDSDVRHTIASHPDLTKEHIDKLANDKNWNVRKEITKHPNLHKEHIDKLVNDDDSDIRRQLSYHPNLHKEHMNKLVNDEDKDVRSSIVEHPNLHKEHLDKLSKDTNKYTRTSDYAKQRLESGNYKKD